LEPTDFELNNSIEPEYINVPGGWATKNKNGKSYPELGYATYRLRIKVPENNSDFSFRSPSIWSSARVWINDTLCFEKGKVGKSKDESIPEFLIDNIFTNRNPYINNDTLEVIIQIADFYKGGIYSGIFWNITFGHIDNKLEEYTRALAENDGDNKQQIEDEIKKQQERKGQYKEIEKQLKESGEAQISTSDPESRQIMLRNNITEVAYNVQTTVDAKNNIPIDYKVTNQNDSKAMGNMVQRAKSILRTNKFTVLYDKGFHTGSELKTAQDLGVETIVAIPGVPSTSQAPNHDYNYEHFIYDETTDTYICPQGQTLRTNGSWYKELTSSGNTILFKQYKTRACKSCQARSQCTRSKNARLIQRSEFADYYEKNRRNSVEKEHLYKRRQTIAEHPFGTIKRQWGFSYILTKKGINRASSDVGFMFIAYNLRRILNILTRDQLKEYLRVLLSLFLAIFDLIGVNLREYDVCNYPEPLIVRKHNISFNLT